MHVAVDARELVGQRTGTGRYLERLLFEWQSRAAAHAHTFTLYAHGEVTPEVARGARVVVLPGRGGTGWEQVTLAAAVRRDRPAVLFAPAYTAPLTIRTPVALTVHDVSFLAHPEWFRPRERWRRRLLTRASARRASVVLTVSRFSADEIVRHVALPRERIRVVPHGIERAGRPEEGNRARASAPPVLLFVGSLLNRRHIPELIEATALVRSRIPAIRLVLVGDNRTWPRQDPQGLARRFDIADCVDVRAFVPDEELRRLYGVATVFVFLSEYEGFGFTPLEALSAGAVPLVLDTPVAREVYGDAARFVPRPDPGAVADAIVELLTGDEARRAVLMHGPAVLGRYHWSEAAATTLAALEQAACP
jgi:glycosyltransferase involved in cell wall biosynthesis